MKCSRNPSNWTLPVFPVKKCCCCWKVVFIPEAEEQIYATEADSEHCGLRVFGRRRLRDWKSDQIFFFIPFFGFLWIIRCTAIVWLVTSWLKQLGWMWEGRGGGGVCWLATIEVILSYVHVSLLLNAVFSKWEFLWSWNVKWSRKLKTQMSPFFFFPVLLIQSCCFLTVTSRQIPLLLSVRSAGDRYSQI